MHYAIFEISNVDPDLNPIGFAFNWVNWYYIKGKAEF